MIGADRLARLARNLVGEVDGRRPARTDPIEDLPYPHELDLEDRATVLRLWSGEVDEITAGRHREVLELLRDVVVDAQGTEPEPRCDHPNGCACAWARAYRLLRDLGAWRG